ncbi:hypothetical protein NJ7G_3834 [Natrinema sp. J7-2]|nr:hypothetical protein NJ7G_3834 [Natrinema sp. J7-2]
MGRSRRFGLFERWKRWLREACHPLEGGTDPPNGRDSLSRK